jgi:hypothetical protein
MATACDGDSEAPCVSDNTPFRELMVTACDGYVNGDDRFRGLGCDGDRSGDCTNDLVETVMPVIYVVGFPA